MSDRKLRLLPPPPADLDDEPPFDDAELRAAEALRDGLGADPLAADLRAAWAPDGAAPVDHDALLAAALGDDAVPPTEDELVAAEALREALDGRGSSSAADLATALRAAARPAPLDEATNAALVDRALARSAPRRASSGGGRVLRVAFGAAAAVVAMAAGFALVLTTGERAAPPSARAVAADAPPLIPARSTSDLFDATEPFPRTGGESARIDRIATARTADLRANRFAAWGVR